MERVFANWFAIGTTLRADTENRGRTFDVLDSFPFEYVARVSPLSAIFHKPFHNNSSTSSVLEFLDHDPNPQGGFPGTPVEHQAPPDEISNSRRKSYWVLAEEQQAEEASW
ncbi:hypothetical protein KM043_003639 [Ampulex compressa]|nr:hypothetical protein KM043_003639 [Ampulex compressa]